MLFSEAWTLSSLWNLPKVARSCYIHFSSIFQKILSSGLLSQLRHITVRMDRQYCSEYEKMETEDLILVSFRRKRYKVSNNNKTLLLYGTEVMCTFMVWNSHLYIRIFKYRTLFRSINLHSISFSRDKRLHLQTNIAIKIIFEDIKLQQWAPHSCFIVLFELFLCSFLDLLTEVETTTAMSFSLFRIWAKT